MAEKFNLKDLLNQRSQELSKRVAGSGGHEPDPADVPESGFKMIDIYDLVPANENFYHVDLDIKNSIRALGILQPLLVKPLQDGKYKVIAGHNRRLCCIELYRETEEEKYRMIPCMIKTDEMQNHLIDDKETGEGNKAELNKLLDNLALIMANKFREKTDYEKMLESLEADKIAEQIKEKFNLSGRTREIVTEITGVKDATLARYKAIHNNLNKDLKELFRKGEIGYMVAYEASTLDQGYQMKAYAKYNDADKLTLPDIAQLKRQQEKEKPVPGQIALEEVGTDTDRKQPERQQGGGVAEGTGENNFRQVSGSLFKSPEPKEDNSAAISEKEKELQERERQLKEAENRVQEAAKRAAEAAKKAQQASVSAAQSTVNAERAAENADSSASAAAKETAPDKECAEWTHIEWVQYTLRSLLGLAESITEPELQVLQNILVSCNERGANYAKL